MRILHLSDIHFASLNWNPSQLISKRLLGNLNYALFRRQSHSHVMLYELIERLDDLQPDLVVCSGDLTTTALKSEFKKAKALIGQFKARKIPFYALPGNHDVYTPWDEKHSRFYRELAGCLPLKGAFDSDLAVDRCAAFDLGENKWLVMLDCARYLGYIQSGGTFTQQEEASLTSLLEKIPIGDQVVLCCHFPFFQHEGKRRRLQGGERLQKLIREFPQIQLYLHGHTHRHALADLRLNSLPYISDSGSICVKKQSSFNLIHWENDNLEMTPYLYNQGWFEWV